MSSLLITPVKTLNRRSGTISGMREMGSSKEVSRGDAGLQKETRSFSSSRKLKCSGEPVSDSSDDEF